jgi:hypothetical protein
MYAEYQTIIRNNLKIGKEYFDRANKVNFSGLRMQANGGQHGAHGGGGHGGRTMAGGHDDAHKSDMLFSDEAVIVHISGNKESSGRMLKVSNGLKKCFGWDR